MSSQLAPEYPTVDFARIGPQIGSRFPDVMLSDQHGNQVNLHASRGSRRAIVVFYRSAAW